MNIRLKIVTLLTLCIALWTMAGTARGQAPTPSPGDLFVSVNLRVSDTNGLPTLGPIYQYTFPAGPPPTVFPPNLSFSFPRGLAFDSAGNLFVATENFDGNNFQGTILKIAPGGTPIPFFPTDPSQCPFGNVNNAPPTCFPSNFFLQVLAIDNAGNVFVSGSDVNTGACTIYKVSSTGGSTVTVTQFFGGPSNPFHSNNTVGIAFDSAGNLFVAANVEQKVYKLTPDGALYQPTPTGTPGVFVGPGAFPDGEGPSALTFDASGNLFVSSIFTDASGEILEFTPAGSPYPATPTGTPGVFATLTNFPKGLAFDSAGNLFVAETGASTSGDILEYKAPGFSVSTFDDGTSPPDHFGTTGNLGPEWLAFAPNTPASPTSPAMVSIGAVGSANTNITLTFPSVTRGGTTMATPVDPSSAGYTLGGSSLGFDITTTASYTTPIIVAFQVVPPPDASQLTVLHSECGNSGNSCTATCTQGCTLQNRTLTYQCDAQNNCYWIDSTGTQHPAGQGGYPVSPATNTVYASVNSLSPFVVAKVPFKAQVQQPINADRSSVFSVKRGVVPVVFMLTSDGVTTCQLPPATISLSRISGGVVGSIDESAYLMKADSGSNFRIDNTKCQYVYNLAASSLGPGTYKVNISIAGIVVGSGTFALK
jgi:hypothetical protein